MALTQFPTAAAIKAKMEADEVGMFTARSELEEAWVKENLARIKVEAKNSLDNLDPHVHGAKALVLLVDLITLIERIAE